MSGLIDMHLAEKGQRRRVVATVPTIMLAPEVIVKTDYIVTMSERVARTCAMRLPIRILELPLKLDDARYGQFWHPRTHQSLAHKWFRRKVVEAAAAMG